MMIKLAQKRVLLALGDNRIRLSQDVRDETDCSAGELLSLSTTGFTYIPDDAHVRITVQGLEYLSALDLSGEER